jgi:hypothetical protein
MLKVWIRFSVSGFGSGAICCENGDELLVFRKEWGNF